MIQNGITGELGDQIRHIGKKEMIALLLDYFENNEKHAREFVNLAAARALDDKKLDRGWLKLKKMLNRVIERERKQALCEEKDRFLNELEKFKISCQSGKCVKSADFDDKRRAYADGDIYFEDYYEEFIDMHDDIQAFKEFQNKTQHYFKQDDFKTALRAYEILIDIYSHDMKKEPLFVSDDDFPDANLSEVRGIDIKKMKKNLKACQRSISHQEK